MSVKKNIAYNTILNVSNVIFPIITVPYVSRVLGAENVGIVNFASTYASYFALFAFLGIPLYGMREIAKLKNDELARRQIFTELFLIVIINTIIAILVYICTIYLVPRLNKEKELLLIAGLAILFVPFNVDWFFSGREKFKLITIRSLIVKLVSLSGLFLFVRTRADVIPYLMLITLANVASQLWNFGYMIKTEMNLKLLRLKQLKIKKHFKHIFILFASYIAGSIYLMLNTLLLGFMSDYKQVGYFTSAYRVNTLILPIVISMSPVIIAKINTLKSEKNYHHDQILPLLNQSFAYMMMLAVPATIGLICIAPRFVPLFFGIEFIPSIIPMQLLSFIILIVGISNLFGMQGLIAMGYDKRYFFSILAGTICSLCFNLLLIKPLGAIGAAITSVITETIIAIFTITFVCKIIPIRINIKNIYQPLLAAIPIVPISLILTFIIKNDMIYILSSIFISGLIYCYIMLLIFKNESLFLIIHKIKHKIWGKKY